MIVLLIPLAYSLKNRRKNLKPILAIIICSLTMVVFYPLIYYLSQAIPLFGYTIGKFILFVFLPIIIIFYVERWKLKAILSNLGIRKENLRKSMVYGVLAGVITIIITVFLISTTSIDLPYRIIMFFEAFTEEFFFRGFLFIYLLAKTERKIAYVTSILGFVLIHPQHFLSPFLISTITQGILLTMVTDKTKNIIGAWVGHGLNRVFPVLIRSFI
ncbi:MAG: CPBP family intramembrane metalloprotease [Candidatus Aenigmarchaeota archaeon]|nr:CPBP family intramembrane metalloprotease [Candidatus Aenigmarchaeota archaeon]